MGVALESEAQLGAAVRAQRLDRGLDQRDLAELADVSSSALRRLESGQGSTMRTVLAVLAVLELPLTLPIPEHELPTGRRRVHSKTHGRPALERREERVSLELHRAVARRLRRDGPSVRAKAKANLPKVESKAHGPQAADWVRQWRAALDGPTGELVDLLVRQDEHGVDMRQVSPFAGVLSDDERADAIRRARRW